MPLRPPRPGSRPAIEIDGRERDHVDYARTPPDEDEVQLTSVWRNFATWAERRSKRMAALMGLFGLVSTPISAGFSYYVSHQGFATQDSQAKLAAQQLEELHAIERKVDILLTTDSLLGPRVGASETILGKHGERIAAIEGWAGKKGFGR